MHIAQGSQGDLGTGSSQQCKVAVPKTDLLYTPPVSLTENEKRRSTAHTDVAVMDGQASQQSPYTASSTTDVLSDF